MAHYTDWPEYPTSLLDIVDYPTQADDVDEVQAWLINALVHEMIAVQKELGTTPKSTFADVKARLDAMLPHYHNRGDPSGYDFALGDLTTDGTWRDLDLSAIVPAGATAVNLYFALKDNLTGQIFETRKKGNTNHINRTVAYTQVANLWNFYEGITPCDANRKIQYLAGNTTWTAIHIAIKGWFK